mgnify:CR=1 FL=1
MRIDLRIQLGREGRQGFLQTIAGERVWCDLPLTHDATSAMAYEAPPEDRVDRAWTTIYDGPGLLAGRRETIRSARGDEGGYRVEHADGEAYVIDAAGGSIRRATPGAPLALERALGAPLALAFAIRGLYLLHASALVGDSVIALTAASGGGKSTLAGGASRFPELALSRIADDQLPVRLGREPRALPHFPQPKLKPEEQYASQLPPSLPLGALVELAADPGLTAPDLARIAPPDAIQHLVGATVAAKLFDRELLTRHFHACASAALELPVYHFRYPYGLERIGEALAVLAGLAKPRS